MSATTSISEERWQFLRGTLLSNSLRDALATRGGCRVYKNGLPESARIAFRDQLTESLVKVAEEYVTPVTESHHIANIASIASSISEKCANCFSDGTFRFGIAQKALNSYLKYLWCMDKIAPPPHCPFDGYVLARLFNQGAQWTRGTETDYRNWVRAARIAAAKDEPLCEWELRLWNGITLQKSFPKKSGLRA